MQHQIKSNYRSIIHTYIKNDLIQEWEVHPSVTFSAVVEKCNEKKDSFLCNYPLKYYKQESLVPIIIGMTSGEGGIFASRKYNFNLFVFGNSNVRNEFNIKNRSSR